MGVNEIDEFFGMCHDASVHICAAPSRVVTVEVPSYDEAGWGWPFSRMFFDCHPDLVQCGLHALCFVDTMQVNGFCVDREHQYLPCPVPDFDCRDVWMVTRYLAVC